MIQQRCEGDAHVMASGVAAGIPEGAELVQLDPGNPGLFSELALSGILEGFVRIDESTWKRPSPPERRVCALDE